MQTCHEWVSHMQAYKWINEAFPAEEARCLGEVCLTPSFKGLCRHVQF